MNFIFVVVKNNMNGPGKGKTVVNYAEAARVLQIK